MIESLVLADPLITAGFYVLLLVGLAVTSHGWSWRALLRFLLAVCLGFCAVVLNEELRHSPGITRLTIDLLTMVPFALVPLIASNWSFRDLLRFLPALLCIAATGSVTLLGTFCLVSFGSPAVRTWLHTDEPARPWTLLVLAFLGAITLTTVDVVACLIAEQLFPPFEWFSIGSTEPLDRPEVWLLLLVNVSFFLFVGGILVACALVLPTTVRWRIAVWVIVALAGAGVAARFQGRALTITASMLLSYGVTLAGLRLVEVLTPRWRLNGRWGLMGGLATALLLMLVGIAYSLHEPASFAVSSSREHVDDNRPNILVMVLDTVRAESMSLYGYERATTPHLDARARREGIVFDRAFASSPWTLPTHATLISGLSAPAHRAGISHAIASELPCITEELQSSGFATSAFIGNYESLGVHTGFARGFDHFEARMTSWKRILKKGMLTSSFLTKMVPAVRVTAEDIRYRFLDWVTANSSRPFFTFINFIDAHEPYEVPDSRYDQFRSPSYAEESFGPRSFHTPINDWGPRARPSLIDRARDVHEGSIAYVDAQIELIFQGLQSRGLLEKTLVIVTSDHGEQFGEHGMFIHANSLYTQLLAVPLVIFPPRSSAGPIRIPQPTGLVDVAATIADAAGIADSKVGGRSLMSLWTNGELQPRPILSNVGMMPAMENWLNSNTAIDSVIADNFHYIRYQATSREELFDIVSDPKEETDLSSQASFQSVLKTMRETLDREMADAEQRSRSDNGDPHLGWSRPVGACTCCTPSPMSLLARRHEVVAGQDHPGEARRPLPLRQVLEVPNTHLE